MNSTILDDENMGEKVKGRFKKCGENVLIRPLAKIVMPEVIEIGDYSRIDDFTFVYVQGSRDTHPSQSSPSR